MRDEQLATVWPPPPSQARGPEHKTNEYMELVTEQTQVLVWLHRHLSCLGGGTDSDHRFTLVLFVIVFFFKKFKHL